VSRSLDLRVGVLRTSATYRGSGAAIHVTEERFAALHDPTLMMQKLIVRVDEIAGDVQLSMGIDGDVRNHRAKYFQPGQMPNSDEHGLKLSRVDSLHADDEGMHVTLLSPQSQKRVAVAAVVDHLDGPECTSQARAGELAAETVFAIPVEAKGQTLVFTKACRLAGDVDEGVIERTLDPGDTARELGRLQWVDVWDAHRDAWQAFWERADVEIEGDQRAQQAVRYALYATRIAAPSDQGRSSLGAKNLTGDWYRGAVFWDMEMFQLPLLAAVQPGLSENHVLYRHRRLPAARTLATQDGYDGARFPWQSYATGLEEPPCIGGFLYEQVHLNADIAWGVLHHWDLTGDRALMLDAGLEVLIEVSRYWRTRSERGDDGMWHIRTVCGPDEVHKSVDDNAYTNRMVKEVLRRTVAVIERLRSEAGPAMEELLEKRNVSDEEIASWGEIADHVYFPTLPGEGVLAQFEGFEQYAEPSYAARAEASGCDKTNKQADTLLLFQTLGATFWEGDLERHYDVYAPLCTQTSSLSMCTHALLAARLGRKRDARKLFDAAAGVDLADSYANTRHGIHGAGQAGIWLAVVQGFGGLETHPSTSTEPAGLSIQPNLPPWWDSLTYRFTWRGAPVKATVTPTELTLENLGSERAEVIRAGRQIVELAAGESKSIPVEPRWEDPQMEAVIFDLDGVLVKTDHFHYQAWKALADELGLAFDEEVNHQLRGVSRQESLRIIYRHNNAELPDEGTFTAQCTRKNERYKQLIEGMTADDVLPGAIELLEELRSAGVKCALASASRNAARVLERTGLGEYMDAISDGTCVTKSKPSPQGFTVAARRLRVLPWNCVGVEDAAAGVEAIHRAGMVSVGVGESAGEAHVCVGDVSELSLAKLREAFAASDNPVNPYMETNLAKMRNEQS
jgi:beta-phosphoglucomutase